MQIYEVRRLWPFAPHRYPSLPTPTTPHHRIAIPPHTGTARRWGGPCTPTVGISFPTLPDAHTDSSPAQPTHPVPPTLEVTQRLSDRRETDSCGFVLGRGRASRWGTPRGDPQSCLLHTLSCGLAVMTEGRTSCCFPDDLQDRIPNSA